MNYQARDLVARYEAFQQLAADSSFMMFIGYLILLLFIFLDTFPLIAKITFGESEYAQKQKVAFYRIRKDSEKEIKEIEESMS